MLSAELAKKSPGTMLRHLNYFFRNSSNIAMSTEDNVDPESTAVFCGAKIGPGPWLSFTEAKWKDWSYRWS
jgi:hypothetical protein